MPEVFAWLKTAGNIETMEMYRTFNCGIGMVLVVDEDQADDCLKLLTKHGESAWKLGKITERGSQDAVTFIE